MQMRQSLWEIVESFLPQMPNKRNVFKKSDNTNRSVNRQFRMVNLGLYSGPRHSNGNALITAGTSYFTYFTPLTTATVGNISVSSAGTISTGATLIRFGLYTVNESTGALTLVARTASDVTIFSAINTLYTRAFSVTGGYPSTYTLQQGTRYA